MTLLMQGLVRRVTGIPWRDLIGAQVPALVCTVGLVVLLLSSSALLHAVVVGPAPWLVLAIQTVIGSIFFVCFVLLSGISELQTIVKDTLATLRTLLEQGLTRRRNRQPNAEMMPASASEPTAP
jgi:hypothetical protein